MAILGEQVSYKKDFSIKGNVESPIRYCTNVMIYSLVQKHCPHVANILDVGCGKGVYYKVFLDLSIRGDYLGIDINNSALWNSQTINNLNIEYQISNAETLHKIDHRFNYITSFQVLEHINNDRKSVAKMFDCLVDGGYLTLTVPSKYSWFLYGRHGYRRYSVSDLKGLFDATRCEMLEVK